MKLIPDDNPDPRELDIHPRRRLTLTGHAQAEVRLRQAYASGRMHHAWILTGPRGIGKATLAFRFARFILRHPDITRLPGEAQGLAVAGDDPVARQVAAASHPDLHILQRAYDPKNKRLKTEIAVDDARDAEKLFERKSTSGGYRICIIDAADELNESSANSILKTLEEPPPRSLFLIINHAAGAILPTIRSRCIRLNLSPLPLADVARVTADAGEGLKASPAEIETAAAMSGGSPGRALELIGSEGAKAFASFLEAARGLPRLARQARLNIAEVLSGRAQDADFQLFFELLEQWIAGQARQAALENDASAKAWADAHGEIAYSLRLANGLNLDRRQMVLEAFDRLEAACGA